MKNADKPITELTKREHFSLIAMQAIIQMPFYESVSDKVIVQDAISIADELLNQLENK